MLNRQTMPAADLLSGIGLAVFAVFVLVRASRMPMSGTYGGVDNAWYVSPAAFPLVIGTLLLLAASGLVVRGVLKGGAGAATGLMKKVALALSNRPSAQRIAMIFGLLLTYVAALQFHWFAGLSKLFAALQIGRLIPTRHVIMENGANYWCASCLFLVGFVLLFGRPERRRGWIARMGCCVLLPLIIGFLFSE